MQNLILIGEIKELFCSDSATAKEYLNAAKFILFSIDNVEYKMIMHLESEPYKNHPQAVLKYMEDNNLNEIYLYGGAKITISPSMNKIITHDFSYTFKSPNDEKLKEVIKSIWPKSKLTIMTYNNKREEAVFLSKKEIQELAEKL